MKQRRAVSAFEEERHRAARSSHALARTFRASLSPRQRAKRAELRSKQNGGTTRASGSPAATTVGATAAAGRQAGGGALRNPGSEPSTFFSLLARARKNKRRNFAAAVASFGDRELLSLTRFRREEGEGEKGKR
ncbi:hypothetical protein HPB50_021785 [Hyalomma asiaticum]|uniref:Uncharacterized protein n=1 Tax=Hyalomma asiaticum TaxID=266040 RepID=A0ACB7SD17_HYAAI|nr:hypothetical protein HPB50_021785 [Hyalomma asiaticum]